MKSGLKVVVLSAITLGALGYVILERTAGTIIEAPAVTVDTLDIPETPTDPPLPPPDPTPSTPIAYAPSDSPPGRQTAGALSTEEEINIGIYERLSPGVVNITSLSYTYDFFFQPVPRSGSGSGVVIDDDGHIITNYHVIEAALESAARFRTRSQIEVTLADQSRHPAEVVGIDPSNDLAILRVDAPGAHWVAIPFGSNQGLRVGQKVLAIGNPFGLDRTLTTGIISSLGRAIEATNGRVIEGVIQTDAAINPGNSGGPLLDTRGQIIGINTAIVSGASGVGFAVPVDTVRRVANDLLTYGRVRRAYLLGEESLLNLSTLGPLANPLDLGTHEGVMIAVPPPQGSPAAAAGLRGPTRQAQVGNYLIPADGDVIVGIEGRAIRNTGDIATVLEAYRPGDDVDVTVYRNRQRLTLGLTLGEAPVQ